MKFKDYYATLGVAPVATQDEIKRAYRKLARRFHPDVSKEPDAEARFKEVAEAHEALIDVERRAAYDAVAQRHAQGAAFEPPPGLDSGFEFSGRGPQAAQGRRARGRPDDRDYSEFFEAMFGRAEQADAAGARAQARQGQDHHAKLAIDLTEACHGARRMVSLSRPVVDARGQATLQAHQLEVTIPRGIRPGQHLRLTGQGAPGHAGAPAGDLYLEIQILPHPLYRLDGGDIYFDLPVTPWEAALGATVSAPTPGGRVELAIPAGSPQGRKMRLRGRGLPGQPDGDLYAVLSIALPPASTPAHEQAYHAYAQAFASFDPRAHLKG